MRSSDRPRMPRAAASQTMKRAYLATLARHHYLRHLFPAMAPGDINHAIATRITQLQPLLTIITIWERKVSR